MRLSKLELPSRIALILLAVIILSHGFAALITRVNILDNLTHSISDLDLVDIYFSNGFAFKDENVDKDIVIVNIGDLDREGIAKQLNIISSYKPKVVGVNAIFAERREDNYRADSLLRAAFARIPNLVFTRDSVDRTHEYFISPQAREGFGVFYGEDNVIRSYSRYAHLEEGVVLPFAFEVAQNYDTLLAESYFEDDSQEGYIYFTGYMQDPYGFRPDLQKSDNIFLNSLMTESNRKNTRFWALDFDDVLNERFDPSLLQDKIVLMGYLGSDFRTMRTDDRFWTPIHPELLRGRAQPLMYGVEVHANIISMLINDERIIQSDILDISIIVLILIAMALYCNWIFTRYNRRYQLISKTSLILFINLLIFANLLAFHLFQIKLEINFLFVYLVLLPDTIEILASLNVFNLVTGTSK